ncbi:DUF4097 family beta strand repeat-containing protein [Chryseolinea lacunae]|uniref:DUF4097 family beta strand repeat protein n=1 Tax=Chryseolinea lacunae TaxID=2801331 RepID=A0ABS1KL18_9BACT|nr:DUF4097 family beta strand repeat-containing protein [Chryseolinea lacunae]MBL0740029.1 DUF4097 family beta strand repeat protein [Chryseolinea lacunae]
MKAFTLVVLSLVSLAVCRAQDNEYSFKESFDVSSPAQLTISSSDGNIDVLPSSGSKIEVFYVVKKGNKVLKISKDELRKELTLDVNATASGVSINVEYPPTTWTFGMNERMRVNFRVLVPLRTACDLRSSDGNIVLNGVTGDQKLKTSDGNIHVATVKGDLYGKTSDGNVHVKNVDGSVDLKTSDGNIELDHITGTTVAAGTSDGNIRITKVTGDISVSTSDGDIAFQDVSGSFNGSTSDGNVRGNILDLKKNLTVRTSDGNIDITIPGNIGLDLDVKGESLDVPLTNFSGTSNEKKIRGKANGGGIAVSLSSNGGVSLGYR